MELPQSLLDSLQARQAGEALLANGRSLLQAHSLAEYIPHTPSLSLWAATAAHLALFDWCDAVESLFSPERHESGHPPVLSIRATGEIQRAPTPSGLVAMPGIDVMVEGANRPIRATSKRMPEIALHLEPWYPLMGPFFETLFEKKSKALLQNFPDGVGAGDLPRMRHTMVGEWLDALDRMVLQQNLPGAQTRLDLRGRRL